VRTFSFEPVTMPAGTQAFRRDIREFLAGAMSAVPPERRVDSWMAFDAEFSRRLGARGWIGMTWPVAYGGGARSSLERYVLLEELLAAGAPVGAHWIADRQSGPALLRYGTGVQKLRFLPGITRGELYCCIGMSEPGAGSDLAAVRSRAIRSTDGRWRLRGQKIWTTHAQRAHLMIALVRTADPDPETRHSGLSQFLIELDRSGVIVRPIRDLTGEEHFNEVFFDDVVLEPECLLGREGDGWKQVTDELSFERSGPERYLSSFALFQELLRIAGPAPAEPVAMAIGRLACELWTLRQMSLSVAGQLAAGCDPSIEAAVVKELGTTLEQDIPQLLQGLVDDGPETFRGSDYVRALTRLLQIAPSFSLRGGTREILRGIVARGVGLR
jgi:alkylation response protein AidB-like acyl-CoA dehydrogenase